MDSLRKYLVPLAVPLGFFILVSVFLDVRIYLDRTILVGDSLFYTDPIFKAAAGDAFKTQPSNSLMDRDNVFQNYPSRQYVQSSLSRGEIPWWNPYLGMGVPFAALGTGVFDPVAALSGLVTGPETLTNAIAIASLLIGACGMYGFLGFVGVSRAARILGAIAFAFCGWTVVWLGRQNAMVEIWMPSLFWAAGALVRKPSLVRVGLFGLAIALICLPGHLQTSMHILSAMGVYVLYLLFWEKRAARKRGRALLALIAGASLGIGVALIQIVPMLDLIGHSDPLSLNRGFLNAAPDLITALGNGIKGEWMLVRYFSPTALTAVAPLFFGSPRHSNFWWPSGNFPELTMYVGLLPLFFAVYAFCRLRKRADVRLWFLLAVISAGVAYWWPVFNLINYLPGFESINNGRLRLVYRFAVIVASAIGLDLFMSDTRDRKSAGAFWFSAGFGAVVLLVPAAFYLILPATERGARAISFLGADAIRSAVMSGETPLVIVLVASAAAFAAWKLRWIAPRVFRGTVLLVAFLDLFLVFHDFNPSMPTAFVSPKLKVVEHLRKDATTFRVCSSPFGPVFPPNTKLPYGLFDTDLYSVLSIDRYSKFQALFTQPISDALRPFKFSMPAYYPAVIDLLNVKYVIVPPWPTIAAAEKDPYRASPRYRLVYNDEVLVYENLHVLPRAFVVGRSELIRQPDKVLEAFQRADFDPRERVLLEDPESPQIAGSETGSAEVVSLTSNRVVVRVTSAAPSYLVLSEVNYPGWGATVDGAQTKVYQADYLFRAVYLDGGTHEVILRFWPRSYAVASGLSVACLGMILMSIGVGATRRRANSKEGLAQEHNSVG